MLAAVLAVRRSLPTLPFLLAAACAGAGAAPADGSAKSPVDGASANASAEPASSAASGGRPVEKPFAGSAAEATQLISTAIDKKAADVGRCVNEYRVRKKLPHERVEISVGIDQEGRLLGATLKKGKPDPTLSECVQRALADAAFPKSHAGVITMTKSYEEIEQ